MGAGQVMVGLYGFATWVGESTAVDACRAYHLVTYLHQLTIPSSGLVSPQVSSLHRLASLALAGRAGSMAVGVELSLVADDSFARPLGMGAGSAIRTSQSDSAVVCMALEASPCCPLSWREAWL